MVFMLYAYMWNDSCWHFKRTVLTLRMTISLFFSLNTLL